MSKVAVKKDAGKLRMALIPPYPLMLVAEAFTVGSRKYGDSNWEKGLAYSRCLDAAIRHISRWQAGEQLDPEDGQHHLGAAIANLMMLIQFEVTHPAFDDRCLNSLVLRQVKQLMEAKKQ